MARTQATKQPKKNFSQSNEVLPRESERLTKFLYSQSRLWWYGFRQMVSHLMPLKNSRRPRVNPRLLVCRKRFPYNIVESRFVYMHVVYNTVLSDIGAATDKCCCPAIASALSKAAVIPHTCGSVPLYFIYLFFAYSVGSYVVDTYQMDFPLVLVCCCCSAMRARGSG